MEFGIQSISPCDSITFTTLHNRALACVNQLIVFFIIHVGLSSVDKIIQVVGLFAAQLLSEYVVNSEPSFEYPTSEAFISSFYGYYYISKSINVCTQGLFLALSYSTKDGRTYWFSISRGEMGHTSFAKSDHESMLPPENDLYQSREDFIKVSIYGFYLMSLSTWY